MDVKRLRSRAEWSQGKLAAYLGCSQPTVCRMEGGQKPSGPIERLLADLDVRIRERQAEGGTKKQAPAA